MYRAPIVLSATALGLAATLGFNVHRAETATPSAAVAVATPPASSSSSSSGATRSSSPSSSSSSSGSSPSTKTATGDAVLTRYGNVQLKVTIAGGKITKIAPVQLPSNDPKSSEISSSAAPALDQSALTKQDGSVDAVSGATYTSNGYRAALQSALDKAGFGTSSTSSSS
jgi:uncharacterized protein with FMN-binding domain